MLNIRMDNLYNSQIKNIFLCLYIFLERKSEFPLSSTLRVSLLLFLKNQSSIDMSLSRNLFYKNYKVKELTFLET